MKSRSWTLLLVAILVVLFWILWPRQIQPDRAVEEKAEAPVAQKQTISNTRPSTPAVVPKASLSQAKVDAQKFVTEPGALEKLVESRNKPIDFYGQTVDQDGNPLPGVQIKIMVAYLSIDGSRYPLIERVTPMGSFDIHDANLTGDGFDLEYMSKEGYKLEPMRLSFGPVGGTSGNPVVFKLWRNDIKEPLITGQKSFHIIPNGKPYVIDLTNSTIAESGDGDLSVWIKYDTQTASGQLSDWLSEIDVIHGGLLEETNDSAMYVAPTTVYAPAFQYNQQIKGGQYGSTGEKRFYVLLKNGQEYGRITIGLYAPYNRQTPGLIRITYAINPTGSRILR